MTALPAKLHIDTQGLFYDRHALPISKQEALDNARQLSTGTALEPAQHTARHTSPDQGISI